MILLDILFSFGCLEPVECFQKKRDVVVFWGFSSSMDESILNSLKAVYFVRSMFRKRELQWSNLAWTIDVAMVDAVLRSSIVRILQSDRFEIEAGLIKQFHLVHLLPYDHPASR